MNLAIQMTESMLQVSPSILRYDDVHLNGSGKSQLVVREILERCSLACSKLDISFASPDSSLLLGLIETKGFAGKFENQDTQAALKQTICYSVLPLAYSLWGALQGKKISEISSLLILPTCLYRLNFTKSMGYFGLNVRIEKATDVNTMCIVLDDYVDRCKNLYRELEVGSVQVSTIIAPLDWSPINFDFETDVEDKFYKSKQHSLGFLFRAKVPTVKEFSEKCTRVLLCSDFPSDDEVVLLKCHSAILDLGFESSAANVEKLIAHTQKTRELNKKDREIAELREILRQLTTEVSIDPPGQHRTSGDIVGMKDSCNIKHPYIGMMKFEAHSLINTILVMVDSGPTLASEMMNPEFISRWKSNQDLRQAFFDDVGQSALNLVTELALCHNNIRVPNITVNKGRFCLIDYDNCHQIPAFGDSPVLKALDCTDVKSMMLSVMQVGLVVYSMENPKANTHAARTWIYTGEGSQSRGVAYFKQWMSDAGLREVFESPTTVEATCIRKFMDLVLLRMLKLTSARR